MVGVCPIGLWFAKVFWQPWVMTNTEGNLERLGRMVRERREELGLRQDQMGPRGGPSTTTLTKIENATGGKPPPATLRKLDMALNWNPGSAAEVLRGGDPLTGPTEEDFARWRAGYEDLDMDPLIPPGGGAREVALTLSDRLTALADSIRTARNTLAHGGDVGVALTALTSADALVTVALMDLKKYGITTSREGDFNAEPTPAADPSPTSSGAQGAKDQEGHAGDGQQSDYDLVQRKRDPRVESEIPEDEDWPADPEGPDGGA